MASRILAFLPEEVVLRLPVPEGAAGPAPFPVPALSPRCVCCDVDTAAIEPFTPAVDARTASATVPIPLCADCAGHVVRSPVSDTLAMVVVAVGGTIVVMGLVYVFLHPAVGSALLAAGLVVAALGAAPPAMRRLVEDRAARGGHHRRFALSAGPGTCTVFSSNPRLLAELRQDPRADG